MNDIDKIRNAYTEAMKALESGYSHKVKDAITNLITIFEQEYPERTQNQEVAFLQLQVAAASIRYHVFRQDVLSATSSFTLLCEESNKLLKTDLLDEHYKQKTCQLIDETEQVLNAFREDLDHVDNSLTGQPSPYVKQYSPDEQFRSCQTNDTCLLCQESQNLCTGSHLAPHFIIGSIFSFDGSRDRDKEIVNEETIASLKKEKKWGSRVDPDAIDPIFGEDIPEDEKTEHKQNALTRDYLFCKRCEDRFGHIENAYSALFTNRKKQLNPAISYLFWLSVFWRLSVSNMCVRLSVEDEENIRQILNAHMPETRKEVDSLIANDSYGSYRYCLYHCDNIKGELSGLMGNLTSDETSIVDIMQADSGLEIKRLLPHKASQLTINNISDDKDQFLYPIMPGSVARMLTWTKEHQHLSIAEQCYGIERELGYTAEEMEYMYNWYFSRLGNFKTIKKRKK